MWVRSGGPFAQLCTGHHLTPVNWLTHVDGCMANSCPLALTCWHAIQCTLMPVGATLQQRHLLLSGTFLGSGGCCVTDIQNRPPFPLHVPALQRQKLVNTQMASLKERFRNESQPKERDAKGVEDPGVAAARRAEDEAAAQRQAALLRTVAQALQNAQHIGVCSMGSSSEEEG